MASGFTHLTATLFIAVATPPSAVAPLDGLIQFEDTYLCSVGNDFKALMTGLIRYEKVGDSYKGKLSSPSVPATYQSRIGKPFLSVKGSEYRATLPLSGTWRGLPLHSLILIEWVESESGFYLVFDATRDQVLEVANKAGFQIPKSGSEYRDGEVLGINVGVRSIKGKGALYCIEG